MTTIIGRPFGLTEVTHVEVTSCDEATWKLLRSSRRPPEPVRGKYVYAFQCLGRTTALFAELRADAHGRLDVCPGHIARDQERDARPAWIHSPGPWLSLPHAITGKRAYYFFLASRIRLPRETIQRFEAGGPIPLCPVWDLLDDASFVFGPAVDGSRRGGPRFLPVMDAISVALELHRRYVAACDAVIGYATEYAEQAPAERAQARARTKELLLARMLAAVLSADPANTLGLDNELAGGSRSAVLDVGARHLRALEARVLARHRACEALIWFLDGALIAATEASYRVFEVEDYCDWIAVYAQLIERVREAHPGQALIARLIEQPSHLIGTYVLRASPAPADVFAIGRKSYAAILLLWSEVVPLALSRAPALAARLAGALRHIARIDIVRVETVTQTFTYRKSNGRLRTVSRPATKVTAIAPEVAIAAWARGGAVGQALGYLTLAVEVVNLGVAAVALRDADPGASAEILVLNIAGASLDAVSAVTRLRSPGACSVRWLGAASAVLDGAVALEQGYQALGVDDLSSAAGQAGVAVGATLSALGCLCALDGAAVATTVVGLPLALVLELVGLVLMVAGSIVSAFTADSELEQFVRHCRFGRNAGSSSPHRPPWATAAFCDWSDEPGGLDHQVSSLLALLAGFTVEAAGETSIRILLGMVAPSSKLRVVFDTTYAGAIQHAADLLIDLGEQTMRQLAGDAQALDAIRFQDVEGRLVVTIRSAWAQGCAPAGALVPEYCAARIRLLLDDGGAAIPTAGPLWYQVYGRGQGLGSPRSSHG